MDQRRGDLSYRRTTWILLGLNHAADSPSHFGEGSASIIQPDSHLVENRPATHLQLNITGLHHVTAIASDPQRNLDFYAGDLIHRTYELADFNAEASEKYALDPRRIHAVGYSNGANIAASLLLWRPDALAGAALLRAMVPFIPDALPDLKGTPALLMSGHHDPIVPAETEFTRRATQLGD